MRSVRQKSTRYRSVAFSQLKLPTAVDGPLVSMTTRHTCVPAASVTPAGTRIVCQVCQPFVVGTEIGPVTLAPFTSMWNVPPVPPDATRMSRS